LRTVAIRCAEFFSGAFDSSESQMVSADYTEAQSKDPAWLRQGIVLADTKTARARTR
jgi:hypothetical protein